MCSNLHIKAAICKFSKIHIGVSVPESFFYCDFYKIFNIFFTDHFKSLDTLAFLEVYHKTSNDFFECRPPLIYYICS